MNLDKEQESNNKDMSSAAGKTFLYFGYGSNLLAKRIHIQNPSAVRKCIGQLKDHRLGFVGFTQRWGGAPATIVPCVGHTVWGAVWEIDLENLDDLDNQEGVAQNVYFPKHVNIEIENGEILRCRVYQRTVNPPTIDDGHIVPKNRPSILYKETIIQGAIESNLPLDYIEELKAIQDNGYHGQADMGKILNQ